KFSAMVAPGCQTASPAGQAGVVSFVAKQACQGFAALGSVKWQLLLFAKVNCRRLGGIGESVMRHFERMHTLGRVWPAIRAEVVEPLDDIVEDRRQKNAEERDAEHAAEHVRAEGATHLGARAFREDLRHGAD